MDKIKREVEQEATARAGIVVGDVGAKDRCRCLRYGEQCGDSAAYIHAGFASPLWKAYDEAKTHMSGSASRRMVGKQPATDETSGDVSCMYVIVPTRKSLYKAQQATKTESLGMKPSV